MAASLVSYWSGWMVDGRRHLAFGIQNARLQVSVAASNDAARSFTMYSVPEIPGTVLLFSSETQWWTTWTHLDRTWLRGWENCGAFSLPGRSHHSAKWSIFVHMCFIRKYAFLPVLYCEWSDLGDFLFYVCVWCWICAELFFSLDARLAPWSSCDVIQISDI